MKRFSPLWAFLISALILNNVAAANWTWTTSPTPGSVNLFSLPEEETEEETFEDGTLSDNIFLSEIMPNPEGTDTDTEWIEIYNSGTTDIDLGNWTLDDAENGSDPYVFPAGTVVEAQDFLVIYRTDSNLALNNDTDSVRLFDFEGTQRDNVTYSESAPEGESYARILTEEETSLLSFLIPTAHAKINPDFQTAPWQWTRDLTLGTTNPIYYFISGTVREIVPFENKVLLSEGEQTVQVDLSNLQLNESLKTSLFKPGSEISGYASKQNSTYKLQTLDSSPIQTSISKTDWPRHLALMGLLIGLGLIGWRKLHLDHKKKARF